MKSCLAASCFAGLMLLCHSSLALQASFEPVANNTLYEDSPTYTSGVSANLFAGPIASGAARRALIKFDLSSLPNNALITAATLVLNIDRAARDSDSNDVVRLHRVLASWGQGSADAGGGGGGTQASPGDATWLARFYNAPPGTPSTTWAMPGGDFIAEPSYAQALGLTIGSVSFTATASMLDDLQVWLGDAGFNKGWIVTIAEGQAYKARRFYGRQAAAADRPRLTITYELLPPVSGSARQVPAFSAQGLFVFGLALAIIAQRRLAHRNLPIANKSCD